jgi:hypothetical protein
MDHKDIYFKGHKIVFDEFDQTAQEQEKQAFEAAQREGKRAAVIQNDPDLDKKVEASRKACIGKRWYQETE